MANPPDDTNKKSFFKILFHGDGRESPSETRNVLLIIATLIAAVTFQAGVNPPGGVWQDDGDGHKAGQAIYASNSSAFYFFLFCYTLALSASILLIIRHAYGFPYYVEILYGTVCMAVTYGSAIFAVTPDKAKYRWLLVAAIVPFSSRIGFSIIDSPILEKWWEKLEHNLVASS